MPVKSRAARWVKRRWCPMLSATCGLRGDGCSSASTRPQGQPQARPSRHPAARGLRGRSGRHGIQRARRAGRGDRHRRSRSGRPPARPTDVRTRRRAVLHTGSATNCGVVGADDGVAPPVPDRGRTGPVTSSFPSGDAATDLSFRLGVAQEIPVLFFPLALATSAAHWSLVRSRGIPDRRVRGWMRGSGGGTGRMDGVPAPAGTDDREASPKGAAGGDHRLDRVSAVAEHPEAPCSRFGMIILGEGCRVGCVQAN